MMTEPSTATATLSVGAMSLAGILTATPFGLSTETMFMATAFTMLGVVGRLGYEISKSADGPEPIKWEKVIALFAGSAISSSCLAVLYLVILSAMGIANDAVLVFGLIFLGFSGAKGFLWVFNTGTGAINKLTGMKLPQFGVAPAQGDGK